MKGSVSASTELATKFMEADKALQASRAEGLFLKEQLVLIDRKKMGLEEIVTGVSKKWEEPIVRVNAVIAALN